VEPYLHSAICLHGVVLSLGQGHVFVASCLSKHWTDLLLPHNLRVVVAKSKDRCRPSLTGRKTEDEDDVPGLHLDVM
jgi:hypothetical protein